MIQYPPGLPLGLHSGRSYQVESPLMRTELSSGRARQRRRFTSVPEYASINWLFTGAEGRVFEAWWRDQLTDGVPWFAMPLDTPLGSLDYTCRFIDIYKGPSRVGPDLWSYSADLEMRERAVLEPGWGLLPDYIFNPEIFDYAMNREWPEYVPGALVTQAGDRITTQAGDPLILE